jgi:hypothetical protein
MSTWVSIIVEIIVIALLGTVAARANPQVPAASISFDRVYGDSGPVNFAGSAIQQTSDGGFITVGVKVSTSLSVMLIKQNASGNVTWQNSYSIAGESTSGSLV